MTQAKLCPQCKSEVHPEASICPHCRTKLKTSFLVKLIAGLLGFGMLISLCSRLTTPSASPTPATAVATAPPKEPEYTIERARRDCKWAVKETLHDPDSADFDSTSSFYAEKKKNAFLVQVTGRAKNGFGALRKITVNCNITSSGQVTSIKQIN